MSNIPSKLATLIDRLVELQLASLRLPDNVETHSEDGDTKQEEEQQQQQPNNDPESMSQTRSRLLMVLKAMRLVRAQTQPQQLLLLQLMMVLPLLLPKKTMPVMMKRVKKASIRRKMPRGGRSGFLSLAMSRHLPSKGLATMGRSRVAR